MGPDRMSTALTLPRDVVLIIDDDAAVLASLKFVLELEGFAVEVFRSAEEMLERPPPPASACLVVDYRLPAMDGVELVSTLRSRGVATPAILITTNPPQTVRRRATEAGLAIVEKPLLGNTLGEAIRSALKT
jgi:FixJ family two-component response regulator